MRQSIINRKTKETDIELLLELDGEGRSKIDTGVGFFNHMLELMARHGFMNLDLRCSGDVEVDYHHTVEDIGIVLGKAFKDALGDKAGIVRYSSIYTPMDETLSLVALDISGRSYLQFNVEFQRDFVGDFDVELVEEFFRAFAFNAEVTLHINLVYGKNTHHIIESIFKGFGRALDAASAKQERIKGVLSTKGIL